MTRKIALWCLITHLFSCYFGKERNSLFSHEWVLLLFSANGLLNVHPRSQVSPSSELLTQEVSSGGGNRIKKYSSMVRTGCVSYKTWSCIWGSNSGYLRTKFPSMTFDTEACSLCILLKVGLQKCLPEAERAWMELNRPKVAEFHLFVKHSLQWICLKTFFWLFLLSFSFHNYPSSLKKCDCSYQNEVQCLCDF